MVRDYKKTPGTRRYRNYTDEILKDALEKITIDELTINAASIKYSIPFGTLYNKYKGLHGKTPGGQPVFSQAEESSILRAAATCADWGFPLKYLDLRFYAKAYLDKQGKLVERFPNNLPGVELAVSLLKRHKNAYGQRISSNIKRSRATVGRESMNKYFDNLESELKDVPPSNIFNYDETNMADDPGKKKCIYRRGVKYPEKIMNFSKSSTTVMICGSADRTLLPPYVIYKSTHLYDTWKERGIVGSPCCDQPCCSRGSRYNRTKSGWIDAATFRDWFLTCFLPHAKRLEGRTVLIGDNLSSHLDEDVIAVCEANNISFVCFVPNSTHLCQPLDVGFFRHLKISWRQTLENCKNSHLRAAAVPKESFPSLLRQAILDMDKKPPKKDSSTSETSAVKRDLISSFRATGIYPLDREKVLKKLPDNSPSPEVDTVIRDSLTEYLREQRYGQESQPSRKKKRIGVEPGKSISTVYAPSCSNANQEDDDVSAEPGEPLAYMSETRQSIPIAPIAAVSMSPKNANEEFAPIAAVSMSPKNANKGRIEDLTNCESEPEVNNCRPTGPEVGQFVLAKFNTKKGKKTYHYVCSIEHVSDDKLVVQGYKSQKKSKQIFREASDDISIIEESDIVMYLPKPKFHSNSYVFPTDVMIKEM